MFDDETTDPYPFAVQFEHAFLVSLCGNAKLYAYVGEAIEIDALSGQKTDPPQLLMRACKAIYKELGRGPDSPVIVMQRVRGWHDDGLISVDQMNAAVDYLTGYDGDLPETETLANEVSRVIRQRMHHDAMLQMHEVYAGNRRPEDVRQTLELAESLGKVETDLGVVMGKGSFNEIARLRSLDRLPTGIIELDAHTGGGLPRGQQMFYLAAPGGGKSIALSSQAAFGLRRRLLVGEVTLELPAGVILARVKANLTGIPINAIMGGDTKRCEELLEQMKPGLGTFYVKHFTAYTTTNAHIEDWVKSVEDREGSKMDLLVVDYADKVGVPTGNEKRNSAEYHAMRVVYERFRIHAHERQAWMVTASQPTRAHRGRTLLDLDHCADSQHKVRIADQVVSINPRDEGETNLFYVAKNRTGASQMKVGPIPHEYHLGRIAPIDPALDVLAAMDPDSPELEQAWEAMQVEQALKNMDGDDGNPFG